MLLVFSLLILEGSAELVPTDDDKAFLTDIMTTGVQILYQIPEAMNIGVYYGKDTAIADIAAKKIEDLNTFTEKINRYTLSPQTKALRDSWLAAADALQADLKEYATLIPGCGSCVAAMNRMYPELINSAEGFQQELIQFFEKN